MLNLLRITANVLEFVESVTESLVVERKWITLPPHQEIPVEETAPTSVEPTTPSNVFVKRFTHSVYPTKFVYIGVPDKPYLEFVGVFSYGTYQHKYRVGSRERSYMVPLDAFLTMDHETGLMWAVVHNKKFSKKRVKEQALLFLEKKGINQDIEIRRHGEVQRRKQMIDNIRQLDKKKNENNPALTAEQIDSMFAGVVLDF
jgi:hypothetical protein